MNRFIHALEIDGRGGDFVGLSLTALSPAATWYFIFLVYRFFAMQGEKTRVPSGRQE